MSDERSGGAPGMLPATVTRFVGRRRELGDVRRLLEQARLVTLTGPGGVGKTRLALHVAAEVRRAFPDGVRFVDLAVVGDGARVPDALAAALRVSDRSARPALDKVLDHLAERRVLLVVDNCEHLVEPVVAVVDRVLRATTGVRVLATSRHVLGLDGEHLFAVPPLAVPDPAQPQLAAVTGQFDAVRLLVDRAVAIRPGFAVTDTNAAAVARLCSRLDGIPLAIELAATRLRSLSVEQVVDRLEGRFALLTTGSAAAQPRQQTLRALVDWSHSLCSPAQRLLWSRLSVFAGSFDLAAAEGVCADDRLPAADVLDLLDHLVAQSIVLTEHDGEGVRFRLLETIRRYGRERLAEAGEAALLERRHRDHYVAVAIEAAGRWCGPHQARDLARLRDDLDNLRAALGAAVDDPDGGPAALRLVAGLRNLWYADDYLAEGRAWLDRALAGAPAPTADRARALWVAAWVSLLQGDVAVADGRLGEAERLGADLGDDRAAAFATSLRGTAALFAGDLDAAARHLAGAVDAMAALGEVEGLLWAYFQQAITLFHRGEDEAARAVCATSLALGERHGERLCGSYTSWVLGFGTWLRGDAAGAERLLRAGLSVQRDFRDAVGVALMTETLAWVAASRDDTATAAFRLAAAQAAWAAAGTTIAAFGPPLRAHHEACVERLAGTAAGAVPAGPTSRVVDAVLGAAAPPAGSAPPGRPPLVPAPAGPAGGLTARELAVAELVAEGLSNKAVAAALVVSPRTVDGHVERILAKLGFSSRAQVAGWLAARRATAGTGNG